MEKRDLITRLKVTPSMGQEKDAARVPSTEKKDLTGGQHDRR